jgi:hypothetical protein
MQSVSNQMNRKIKFILTITIGLLVIFGVYLQEEKRCKKDGVEYKEAELNANKRFNYLAKNYYFDNMIIKSTKKSDDNKNWTFAYIDKAKCEVMINVDECGATDVSGVSNSCVSAKK